MAMYRAVTRKIEVTVTPRFASERSSLLRVQRALGHELTRRLAQEQQSLPEGTAAAVSGALAQRLNEKRGRP